MLHVVATTSDLITERDSVRKARFRSPVRGSINLFPALTKLVRTFFGQHKLLTCQRKLQESVSSIMGATDTFLLRVKGMHPLA